MTNVEFPKVSYRVAEGWVDAVTGLVTPTLGWPTRDTVGVYAAEPGWAPTAEFGDPDVAIIDFGLFDPGVYENIRFTNLIVVPRVAHITLRKCEFVNSFVINEYSGVIGNDLLIEDCTFKMDPPGSAMLGGFSQIASSSMTIRRVAVLDSTEGIGSGSTTATLADPDYTDRTVRIYDSYVSITGPDPCTPEVADEWHGDVFQAYDAGHGGNLVKIRNCRFQCLDSPPCYGTSNIIAPAGENQPFDIDGLLCSGSGNCVYMNCGGDIRNIRFVDESWLFSPVAIDAPYWSNVTTWDAKTVTLDEAGQIATVVATIPYGWIGGPLDPP